MKIVKWAAVAVTALFVLMNAGAVLDPGTDVATPYRVVAAVLALAGVVAVVGLAMNATWGKAAVIVVGGLNLATSITGLFTDLDGSALGIVVGGLGVVLGALAQVRPKAGTVVVP
jgi:hypothetical protein